MAADRLVSLRAAATELGVGRSTLSALLKREPSLAAAITGPGPRGSLLLDLPRLRAAWGALQGPEAEGLSDRARFTLARLRRLWFELQALEVAVGELEASLVDADEIEAAGAEARATLAAAAVSWADRIAPEVAGLSAADAGLLLDRSINAELLALAARADAPQPPPEPLPSIAFPSPPPTLWAVKAAIEEARGRQALLQLQLQRGELAEARACRDHFLVEGRQKRDAWGHVARQLAIRAPQLRTAESVRTTALQQLSAIGLA